MYDFHYGYMKPKYEDSVILNYMDTDCFIYNIKTNDFYNDIQIYFDTSSYPKQNVYNLPPLNKKVLGMMKDECTGKLMKEFIGLRAKMYSYKIDEDEKEVKKMKGVKKSITTQLSCNDFKKCLVDKKLYYDSMYILKSKLHELYTQHVTKLVLSYLDDKRFIRENGIYTFAWGHYNIS